MMSEKQVKEKIYKLQNEIRIFKEVLNTQREGFGRPKGSIKYTYEQINFLQDNKDVNMPELVEAFNLQFGTSYPSETRALYNFMCREGILSAEENAEKIKVARELEEDNENKN